MTSENWVTTEWSLWKVDGHGYFLLTNKLLNDQQLVLVQKVKIELEGVHPEAISMSPSARRTVMSGEGEHCPLFETSLQSHLDILGIERDAARRVSRDDLGLASPSGMTI